MPAIYYLGIDQSLTRPGISILNEKGEIELCTSIEIASKLRGAKRLLAISQKIQFVLKPYERGTTWAMEGPSLGSVHREFDLGEASGVVKLTVLSYFSPLEPIIVEPNRLKRFFTGNGAAKKIDMINRAWALGSGIEDDDNAADALALARVAWATKNKDKLTLRHELEVVKDILSPKAKKTRKALPKNI